MEWNFRSAEELAAALRVGAVTSVELTDEAIARIERDDKVINAICVPDFDRARAAARDADQARARGEDRPLLGIPVTVKESYNIAGLPTTWGMPAQRDYVPSEDAVQVSRLKAAGAVLLGKTNVPLMLRDIQSFNEIYGTTNNPWDHGRTSGGSSGGSAAALASGFGALSIGSDLAGSLRTPAHFCGVYAHKPTLGLVAARGMVAPPAPALPIDLNLAVVGPMARTARDLTLLLDVMAEPDPLTHGVAYDVVLPPARHERLSDFRVLIIEDHPLIPTGSAVRAGVNRVAEALVDEGARVGRRSPLLPDPTEAATLYMLLMLSNAAAGISVDVYEQLQTHAAALSADDMPGLPATAIPTGRSPEGLPVGVQLIGPMFEDRTPLRLAELLEQKIGGFQKVVLPGRPSRTKRPQKSQPTTVTRESLQKLTSAIATGRSRQRTVLPRPARARRPHLPNAVCRVDGSPFGRDRPRCIRDHFAVC
ncbi:amidase [Nocardia sp. 2TAF39]|uniref:amidase n=1 Tax=Nocardia sp. 2TAF39 TaxID=3233017 RepID=UPI003F97C974